VLCPSVDAHLRKLAKYTPVAAPGCSSLVLTVSRPAVRFTTLQSGRCTVNNDPKRPVVDTRHGVCRLTALRGTVFTPSARRRSFFEARQPVREFDPAELVTGPAVSDRWKCVWIIEAAGGHVDGRPVFSAPIRQRGAAAPTESPRDGRRRVVFNRFPDGECEVICIHVRPRHDCRGGGLATTAALTSAGNQRFALNSIPHRATQTPTLNNLAHGAPFESARFYELYFSSDLAPAMQRSWLLLSANCYCGNRLTHGPYLNAPLRATFLRLPSHPQGHAGHRLAGIATELCAEPRWAPAHSPSPPRDPPPIHHATERTMYGEWRPVTGFSQPTQQSLRSCAPGT
jgi:hypothetical protein